LKLKKSQTIQISLKIYLEVLIEPDFVKVDEIEALPPETLFEAVEKGQKKHRQHTLPQNY
jgi:hypothetical protein